MHVRHLFFAVFLGALTLTASAQRTIPFTTDASGTYSGDLYTPSGPGPFPAVVYIHGGSWRSGKRANFERLARDLAEHGYAGFSIDYDLKPHSWPLSLAEANAAIAFLRAHAAEYHLDPTRILIAGESAGGQLAALTALDSRNKLAGAILLNGVYDLTGNYGVIHRYLGGKCDALGTVCKEASPMQQIHASAPPFFIGHGTSDHLVPFASGQLFSNEMKTAGNTVTFYPATGAGHSYWSKNKYYPGNLTAVEAFLATLTGTPAALANGQ